MKKGQISIELMLVAIVFVASIPTYNILTDQTAATQNTISIQNQSRLGLIQMREQFALLTAYSDSDIITYNTVINTPTIKSYQKTPDICLVNINRNTQEIQISYTPDAQSAIITKLSALIPAGFYYNNDPVQTQVNCGDSITVIKQP